jgi:hypothetical protein
MRMRAGTLSKVMACQEWYQQQQQQQWGCAGVAQAAAGTGLLQGWMRRVGESGMVCCSAHIHCRSVRGLWSIVRLRLQCLLHIRAAVGAWRCTKMLQKNSCACAA